MNNSLNCYDIAIDCQKQYKDNNTDEKNKYINTIFAAIDEDNNIKTSNTAHILKGASQCILIHKKISLAYTNWYSWYKIEFIDKEGCVHEKAFDDDNEIYIAACGRYSDQVMSLVNNRHVIYSCDERSGTWEKHIKTVWKLYLKCKECSSTEEAVLLGKLTMKDETIVDLKNKIADLKFSSKILKEERDQYKSLLDDIKYMINNK